MIKRPALYILIPFCLGIVSSAKFELPVFYAFLPGIIFAVLSLCFSAKKSLSHASLCLAIFFLGMAHCCNSNIISADHIANLTSRQPGKIMLRGTIDDDPSVETVFSGAKKINFLLKVNSANKGNGWRKAEGLAGVRVLTESGRTFLFGDEVVLGGLISSPPGLRNPGTFDYAKHLANQDIYSILKVKDGDLMQVIKGSPADPVKRLAYKIRSSIRAALEKRLEKPDDGFAKAMLIGDRSGIGYESNDEFIKTGTVHILSISGLHVGLIAGLVLAVFGLLGAPKKFNFALTMLFLALYSYIAGSSPPIIRSVLMFAVFAVGYILGREPDPLNSLAVAAFLILLWNPKELFSPSFQLSFASVASVLIFTPQINRALKIDNAGNRLFRNKLAMYIAKGASVSVAAWIGTWPIIASYFNIVSPVSLIANLIVIPVSFLSMMAAIALLCVSHISGALANIFAFILGLIDNILFSANHILSKLPFAYFRMPALSSGYIFCYYSFILLWAFPPETGVSDRWRSGRSWASIAILAVLNLSVWTQLVMPVDDAAKITFLDVGQGDSALVELPGGANFLIDAGTGGEDGRFDAGRHTVAPFLWNEGVSRIDAIIITHPHSDHLGGVLYILKNFKVGMVIDNGASDGSVIYKEYLKAVKDYGLRRVVVGSGDKIEFSGGGKIFVLSPAKGRRYENANSGSLVIKFLYKGHSVLFCGDVAGDSIGDLVDSYGSFLRSDIIKVPHHGGGIGDAASVERFFQAVSPSASIISSGWQGRHDRSQLDSIKNLYSELYVTGNNGAITAHIKSSGYKVRPFINLN